MTEAATRAKPAIVDLSNCAQLANTTEPFILMLQKKEHLFDSLIKCATLTNLKSATISGLGTLTDVTVAYYDLPKKEYHTKLFAGMYELVSLNGNISLFEGKPFVHIHAALGLEDYSVIGGHIMEALADPVAEITIIPLNNKITRAYDERTGLKLMCPINPTGNR